MPISVLQSTISASAGSGASFTLAYVSNVTAGSSLHCVVKTLTSTTITVSDNLNGAWIARGALLTESTHKAQQFTLDNSLSGAITVTASLSPNGSSAFMALVEIGGTSGFDTHIEQAQVALSNSTVADSVTTGTVAPSQQPGLISGICYSGGASVASGGTGFMAGSGPTNNIFTESLRYTSTSAIAATFTGNNNSSSNFLSFAALFIEAPSGGISVAWLRA